MSEGHALFGELVLICLPYSCLYLEIQLCLRTYPRREMWFTLSSAMAAKIWAMSCSQENPRYKILQENK